MGSKFFSHLISLNNIHVLNPEEMLTNETSDHVNDYCMLDQDQEQKPNLWMCYAGGSGFGGYGGYGDYVRRVRFFDFDMGPGRVVTYKRVEWGDTDARVDEMMIVDGGVVRGPG